MELTSNYRSHKNFFIVRLDFDIHSQEQKYCHSEWNSKIACFNFSIHPHFLPFRFQLLQDLSVYRCCLMTFPPGEVACYLYWDRWTIHFHWIHCLHFGYHSDHSILICFIWSSFDNSIVLWIPFPSSYWHHQSVASRNNQFLLSIHIRFTTCHSRSVEN